MLDARYWMRYADIRQRILTRLCRENARVAPPEMSQFDVFLNRRAKDKAVVRPRAGRFPQDAMQPGRWLRHLNVNRLPKHRNVGAAQAA